MYTIIDQLQSYYDYLNSQPDDKVFTTIMLQNNYTLTVSEGKSILRLLINMLVPIFPCTVVAMIIGFIVSLVSIFTLFYQYKKTILEIRQEGESSELLKFTWRFSSHKAIYFCAQFIINSLLLELVFASGIFIFCFIISLKEFYFLI